MTIADTRASAEKLLKEMEQVDDSTAIGLIDRAEVVIRDLLALLSEGEQKKEDTRVDDSQYDKPLATAASNEPVPLWDVFVAGWNARGDACYPTPIDGELVIAWRQYKADAVGARDATAPGTPSREETCGVCGATESRDGDWYRVCGECRWAASVSPTEQDAEIQRLQASERDLDRWRTWAQFVYLGGGEPIGTDKGLMQKVCERHDRDILEVRAEAEASLTRVTQENEKLRAAGSTNFSTPDETPATWAGRDAEQYDHPRVSGDIAENTTDNPRSWSAWKACAERAEAQVSRLTQALEKLKPYVQHKSNCPHHMAVKLDLGPGWVVSAPTLKPCTCGLAALLPPPAVTETHR